MGKMEEGRIRYLFETDSICMHRHKLYFSAKNYDALVSIDLQKYECRIEKHFFDKYSMTCCAHAKIIFYKHYFFLIPRYNRYFIRYDLDSKKMDKYLIPNVTDSRGLFTEAVQIDDQIVCFPEFYDSIISINVHTNKITFIKNVKNDAKDDYIFVSNAVNWKNKIVIPFYNRNQMLLLDKNNKDISILDLNTQADGYESISCIENRIFLLGKNHVCYLINENGKVEKKWEDINGVLYAINHEIWIVDKSDKRIYRINSQTLLLEEYKNKSIDFNNYNNISWLESALIQGCIYILVQCGDSEIGLFTCNGKKDSFKFLSIEAYCKEFYDNKLLFVEQSGSGLSMMKMIVHAKRNMSSEEEKVGVNIYKAIRGD